MTESSSDYSNGRAQLTEDSPEINELVQTPKEERIFEESETRQEILARNMLKAQGILQEAGADPKTEAFKTQAHLLANQFTDLEVAAVIDNKTGIYNATGFEMRLREEADAAERTGKPYVLAAIDLNNLKLINDAKVGGGHGAGDDQLESAASMLKRLSRKSDVVGRVGGDEFAILLRTDMKGALAWGQRLIRLMGAAEVSTSIGVAELKPNNLQQTWKLADQRMYQAKQGSRAHGGGQYFDGNTTHLK